MEPGLTVQVVGTRRNSETRKALRFFSERGVKAHLLDLTERGLKRGELENIVRGADAVDFVDTASAEYRTGGFAYLAFDPIEELLAHPLLIKMPIVRCKGRVVVGEKPAEWKELLA